MLWPPSRLSAGGLALPSDELGVEGIHIGLRNQSDREVARLPEERTGVLLPFDVIRAADGSGEPRRTRQRRES